MVCVNKLWQVASPRHVFWVAIEPGEAAQLCVFMWYLYLGVLRRVFRYRHALSVLVSIKQEVPAQSYIPLQIGGRAFDPLTPVRVLTQEVAEVGAGVAESVDGAVLGRHPDVSQGAELCRDRTHHQA